MRCLSYIYHFHFSLLSLNRQVYVLKTKKKLEIKIFQIEETLSHKYDKSYKRNVFVNRSITLYQHSLTLFSSQIYQPDTDGRENKRKAKVKNFKCCYVQACRHL